MNGKSGESQHGVDIFGMDRTTGNRSGVQCKVRSKKPISMREILIEIQKAEKFLPQLRHFIIATTSDRKGSLQNEVNILSDAREEKGQFSVLLSSWDDILLMIDEYQDIGKRFYPAQLGKPAPSAKAATAIPQQFGERLRQVLRLINVNVATSLSTTKIAEMMNIDKVSIVENLLKGTEEPDRQFLIQFSECFGINSSWLLHGEHEPYLSCKLINSPAHVMAEIAEEKPEQIIFVRSNSEYAECAIVFKYGDWRYKILNGSWHVSKHIGGSGTAQLVALYKLIKLLNKTEFNCRGYNVDEQHFQNLIDGQCFPGALLSGRSRNGDWYYALLDLHHKNTTAIHYAEWYGQSFVDAQQVIRKYLSS